MLKGRSVIALCMSRLYDIDNSRFVTELSRHLDEANCTLMIYNINTDLYWNEQDLRAETAVFSLIDYSVTDAVVIMEEKIKSRSISAHIISRARANGVPVVIVDGTYEGCSCVRFDYEDGFAALVRHVIEEHHAERLHFVGGYRGNPFSDAREKVFRQVLESCGLPFDESMVSYGMFWAKPAKAAAEALIVGGELPDAVICANDIMAINVSAVFAEHGIAVPEQVIVTGFDGIDEINFVNPAITSARCSSADLAQPVFRAVQDSLAGAVNSYTVSPVLLFNGSCGCGRKQAFPQQFTSFNDRFYRYQDDDRILLDISGNMQMSRTLSQAVQCTVNDVLHNVRGFLNEACLDNTVNYFKSHKGGFADTMHMVLDTEQDGFTPHTVARGELTASLLPEQGREYPLIFNAMDFMNVPIGFLCFHFRDYELTDYSKIPQIVSALSSGFGGFLNMQYQHYLLQQIEAMYQYDSLTGLCNRLSFSKAFDCVKAQYAGKDAVLNVLLADLDGLKGINDHHGHAAGDRAIHIAASALQTGCPPGALCVRFGGDEMLAVIVGSCDTEQVVADIRRQLDEYNAAEDADYAVCMSIGVYTTVLTEDTDFEELVRNADSAMYTEKQAKYAARGKKPRK